MKGTAVVLPAEAVVQPTATMAILVPMTEMVLMVDVCAWFVPMTVDTKIGGVHVQLLVDTGAGVSLIHATTLKHLQAHGVKCVVHQQCGAQIIGINRDELATLRFVHLPVTLGGTTCQVEFQVVPACPASVLLGTAVLHDFGVGIHFEERVLALPDGAMIPFLVTTGACYGVFLAEELVVDLQSVT